MKITNDQGPMTKQIPKMQHLRPSWKLRFGNSLGLGPLTLGLLLFTHLLSVPNVSAESILLKNAIVHTVSGEIYTNGQVLINDDKIEKVSDETNVLTGSSGTPGKIIDLKGQHLYPGLIALDSALGLERNRSRPRHQGHH